MKLEDLLDIANNKDETTQHILSQLFAKYTIKFEDVTREINNEISKKNKVVATKANAMTQTISDSHQKSRKNKNVQHLLVLLRNTDI
jgi:hypothetical protein